MLSRETIELAYLVALQHLPPRQRAVLILRDVLDWSARETAALLETTEQSVNSALQRAKAKMRAREAAGRHDSASATALGKEERVVLERFMSAWERADAAALTALMREDARWAMPPARLWFDGRVAIAKLFERFPISAIGDVRMVRAGANRQPAAASYLRTHGQAVYRLVSLNVLRIEAGQIAEVITFAPPLIAAFGLPPTL
jgi:RNA polymerase sigma-70 factor (ECF subfamily)